MDRIRLKDYEEDIFRCIRCGFCRAVCPVLQVEDMNEIVGPRSFVLTGKGLITHSLKPTSNIADRVYQCIECGACDQKCPPGVRIEEIVRSTRTQLIESQISPPKNIQTIIDSIQRTGRLDTTQLTNKTRTVFEAPIERKAEVLYYIGCAASQFERKQAQAMIKILQKAEIDFTILKGEECCGLPLLIHGFRDLFNEQALQNSKIFNHLNVSTIVTTCPGCYRTFSQLYPDTDSTFTIEHSSEFISNLITNGQINLSKNINKTITYHDPCDLSRHSNISDHPREILKKIPGAEFIEASKNKMEVQCCGAGGGFSLAYPEIAKKIGKQRLISDVIPTGADILVSSCPNCIHHFKDTIQNIKNEKRKKLEILDITELVLQTL
ncbi:MAG: (Fe-S)-binding protein [Candidatus Thorarchaeota archaeon]